MFLLSKLFVFLKDFLHGSQSNITDGCSRTDLRSFCTGSNVSEASAFPHFYFTFCETFSGLDIAKQCAKIRFMLLKKMYFLRSVTHRQPPPKKVLLRLRSRILVSAVHNCFHVSFAIRMSS